MNVSLTDELKDFVQKKIETGQYPSEEAVIEAALKRLRDQDTRAERPCRHLMTSSITSLSNTVPVRPMTALPWRRSLRRPPRSRIPWPASSSRKSERTASDGPLFL